jgi:hypothetical protein
MRCMDGNGENLAGLLYGAGRQADRILSRLTTLETREDVAGGHDPGLASLLHESRWHSAQLSNADNFLKLKDICSSVSVLLENDDQSMYFM